MNTIICSYLQYLPLRKTVSIDNNKLFQRHPLLKYLQGHSTEVMEEEIEKDEEEENVVIVSTYRQLPSTFFTVCFISFIHNRTSFFLNSIVESYLLVVFQHLVHYRKVFLFLHQPPWIL